MPRQEVKARPTSPRSADTVNRSNPEPQIAFVTSKFEDGLCTYTMQCSTSNKMVNKSTYK